MVYLKNKKIWGVLLVSLGLIAGIGAFEQSEDPKNGTQQTNIGAKTVAAKSPAVKLEQYNGNFFTINKPSGWNITTAGVGPTLAVWMKDPQEPARQAFFFGAVGPFYLSHQQKAIDQNYMASGGYPIQWVDMPVVAPQTASNFLTKWNSVANSRIAQGFMAERPIFKDLTIISTQPIPNQFGGSSELIRAIFVQNGKIVEGLFTATIYQNVPFMNGPGGHQGYALMFSGVTAPKNEFSDLQPILVSSLGSFNLSEQYVQSYISSSREAFAGVMRAGQTLRETSDIITKGWNQRQKIHDILSEKRSDATLGKERVYDPATGQVYEFPNGWYQKYDINRNKYNKPGLQPIPDNDHTTWTSPTQNGPSQVYIQ